MKMPWKLKMLLISIFGEDRIKNRRVFAPDFSESSFAQLPLARKLPTLSRDQIVDYFIGIERPDFFMATDKVLPLTGQIEQHYPDWKANIVSAAEAICDRGLPIYQIRAAPLNGEFPWEELSRGQYGDQLYISRPQRFGFAPVLAQAALFDSKFISSLNDVLVSWQKYAITSSFRWPYNSNHAVVYRVIALCWCWLFVGALYKEQRDPDSRSVLYNILAILNNDILYLGPRLGESHPNNHLLADYFVGWFLQYLFSELIPTSMNFSGFEQKFQAELQRQFYSDGGSFEHAIHYHEHGCEMVMIYRLLVGSHSISNGIDEHIRHILRFQARLNGPLCKPWALGDTTEDTLLPLDHTQGWSSRAIHAVHNHLYPEQCLFFSDAKLDQKAFWLLAGQKAPLGTGLTFPPILEEFQDSGCTHWIDSNDESELLFRTGVPPNTEYMQGHMHSDILSLYWRVSGIDVLASSGTYTYRFVPQENGNWRNYFCGPMSHSGVIIDAKDPLGRLDQDFRRGDNGLRVSHCIYGDPAIASLCIGEVHAKNCYNGFKRGVMHLPGRYSVVLDIFTKLQSTRQISAGWQFDKALHASCDEGTVELQIAGQEVARIISLQGTSPQLYKGEISPMLGWQSDNYGVKMPTHYARFNCQPGTDVSAYILTSQCNKEICAVNQSLNDNNRIVINLKYEYGQDTLYFSLTNPDEELDIDGVTLKSRAIIYQQRHAAPDRLIAIDGMFSDDEGPALQDCSSGKTLHLEKQSDTGRWKPV